MGENLQENQPQIEGFADSIADKNNNQPTTILENGENGKSQDPFFEDRPNMFSELAISSSEVIFGIVVTYSRSYKLLFIGSRIRIC